jgi:hypothetical protein
MNSQLLLLVGAVVTLAFIGVGGIISVTYLMPTRDNTQLIATIAGFIGPSIVAFIAAFKSTEAVARGKENAESIQSLHLVVNSRLTQLLEQTALASNLTGKAEGIAASEAAAAAVKKEGT